MCENFKRWAHKDISGKFERIIMSPPMKKGKFIFIEPEYPAKKGPIMFPKELMKLTTL